MGSLVPFSITTNCTMKSLLIFATVLAVGLAEEAKAVVATAPYLYGYPGYGYAPVAYNNVPYTYAPPPPPWSLLLPPPLPKPMLPPLPPSPPLLCLVNSLLRMNLKTLITVTPT